MKEIKKYKISYSASRAISEMLLYILSREHKKWGMKKSGAFRVGIKGNEIILEEEGKLKKTLAKLK